PDEGLFSTDSANLDYTAQGAAIDVTATMTLVDINYAINAATYASGDEVVSSIIDNTLVLKNLSTGEAHQMQASDIPAVPPTDPPEDSVLTSLGVITGGVVNTFAGKIGANAEFTVNGMASMSRSSNTGLTDVITGMTLTLASDAEGKNANIVVSSNMTTAQTAINTFISAFNDLTTYVRAKTTTVKNADSTYTRGSLASEQNLRYTGYDLLATMNQDFTNTGVYQNLLQIGISVNADLSATISDSTKLSTAMNTNLADMTKMMDGVMGSLATKVGTYTGMTGYVNQSLTSANNQVTNITSRIESMNARVTRRQDSLVKQYTQMQAQMETLMTTFNMNTKIYG
ncbi:MAG: flagellar filament capping protein FliD, partial [Leptolinea sp.]